MEQDQEFVEYLVRALVDHPTDVKTERTVDEMGVLITLTVNPADMGKIIGRMGNTAKAIRTLLRIIGMKNTLIHQTLGCGNLNGGYVNVTLTDLSKLYEGVWNDTLLNATRSASFFGRMNGGCLTSAKRSRSVQPFLCIQRVNAFRLLR